MLLGSPVAGYACSLDESGQPIKRLAVRKISEALRRRAGGLSSRKIAASLGVGQSTASDYLKWVQLAGLIWLLAAELTDAELEALLLHPSGGPSHLVAARPDWLAIHCELNRPGVTLSRGHGCVSACTPLHTPGGGTAALPPVAAQVGAASVRDADLSPAAGRALDLVEHGAGIVDTADRRSAGLVKQRDLVADAVATKVLAGLPGRELHGRRHEQPVNSGCIGQQGVQDVQVFLRLGDDFDRNVRREAFRLKHARRAGCPPQAGKASVRAPR